MSIRMDVQRVAGFSIPIGSETDLLFRPDDLVTDMEWEQWRRIAPVGVPERFQGTRSSGIQTLHDSFFPAD